MVMTAVSQNGHALEFATDELRGDREVVMKAVSENGYALEHATEELRADREVAMKAVSQEGPALQHAREEMRGDREVVMKAVSQNGYALKHATEELRGDREVVMRAVSENGHALEHATDELRGDREMMEVALANAPEGVMLSIMLLSGRCCNQIFDQDTPVEEVLAECGRLLDMHPSRVRRSGTLMSGTVVVTDLRSLDAGKVHELTLVLS